MTQPPVVLPTLLHRLRADLISAGYDVPGITEHIGEIASAALDREEPAAARRALAPLVDPCATLTKLLFLGDPVPDAHAAAAFASLGVDGAVELGLVAAPGDGQVRPLIDLRPYSAEDARGGISWWLASDLGELATGQAVRADYVLGAGGASLTLAQVTVRDDVVRVLDLGTGCGIQAMHALRHARTVVATDLSERALAFARFNTVLNAMGSTLPDGTELELRSGSMLDPVRTERFDLVVSNPPFVITPRGSDTLGLFEYRDGGRSGDDLVRDLIQDVGEVLEPGGIAQLLANWEHRAGETWQGRVGAWLDASGLDGWIVQREVLDPAQYAETWIRDGGTTPDRDPDVWASAYGAWLDDFESRNVEAIGFGIVTLRKPLDGVVTLRRMEEYTGTVHQPLGTHIAASLRAHDWLGARSDEALLEEHLVVAGDVTEERFYTPGQGDPGVVILRQGGGFGRAVQASSGLAALVGACDGELSTGRLLNAIAALFDVDPQALTAETLPWVRGLVRDGMLLPQDPCSASLRSPQTCPTVAQ